ncbi:hypothetical protein JCM9279_002223 [Rhodotorula babjevae]
MPRSNSTPPPASAAVSFPTVSEPSTATKPLTDVGPIPARAPVASPRGLGKPISTRTTGGFSWSSRLNLDVDFAAPVPSGTVHYLPNFPLGGTWHVFLITASAGAVQVCVTGARIGQLDRVEGRMRLATLGDDERQVLVVDKRFAPVRVLGTPGQYWTVEVSHDMMRKAIGGSSEGPSGLVPLELVFDLSQEATGSTPQDAQRAFLLGDSSSSPIRNDVRIFFPNVGPVGAEIWTSSHLLSASSPYFSAQLLDTSSAMGALAPASTSGSTVRPDEAPSKVGAGEVDDEDDDTDARSLLSDADSDGALETEFIVPSLPSSLFDMSRIAGFTPHELVVTDRTHLFSTYRAVLRFLETGLIAFAPLYSSCVRSYEDGPCQDNRLGLIEDSIAAASSSSVDAAPFPLPVSPKSVYRLAVHLGLTQLARQCLRNLAAQLSPITAAEELFGSTSRTDAAWRGVVVEFVVRQWDDIVHGWRWKHELEGRGKRSGKGMNVFEVLNLVHEARLAHLRQRRA